MSTSTFELLLQIPRQSIVEDLERLRNQKAALALEEELLERVLQVKDAREGVGGTSDESGAQSRTSAMAASSRRVQITAVMADEPEKAWTPAEIVAGLEQAGVRAKKENTRMTIRRMVEAGQLEKVAHGQYRLPSSDNGAPPQATLEDDQK